MRNGFKTGLLGAALLATTAIGAYAADVTYDRLLNAEKEGANWLQNHRDYSSTRYSPLDQINKDNVKNLKVAFTTAIGGERGGGTQVQGGHQSTPLVNDGGMYVVDAWGAVYKVDLSKPASGRIAWIMDPGVDKADIWIASNRGVALYKDMVISVTGNGKVNWTKADTGELVRSIQVEDPKTTGYSLTAPPLVLNGKLIVPGSGGDRGARSHVDAINADTGAPIWRWYSIPKPGEKGSETWKDNNNAWEHGGGAFWQTGSYDPASNLTYWGTGQPVPMFDPEYRPGDNLFTNSSVALNADNGQLVWYFQYTPGDFLDYDEIGDQILVDTTVNGQPRKILSHFGRNGFFYNLDRGNGLFLNAAQYVEKLNWTAGIDPKTGKPVEYDPNKDLQTYKIGSPAGRRAQGAALGCPQIQGGVNYFPTSYSQKTKFAYGAGIEACSNVTADAARSGGKQTPPIWNGGSQVTADRELGSVAAMNPSTGALVKRKMLDYASYSGLISTAGGLVFTTSVDGTVYALDDTTLDILWSFNTGSISSAPPMTYSVNGKQYVAVLIGGNTIAKGHLAKSPEMSNIQNTSMLYVFAL
ncbi:MAG: PQQ-binding-like beta-propeller repeat protein [Bauldia sp.]